MLLTVKGQGRKPRLWVFTSFAWYLNRSSLLPNSLRASLNSFEKSDSVSTSLGELRLSLDCVSTSLVELRSSLMLTSSGLYLDRAPSPLNSSSASFNFFDESIIRKQSAVYWALSYVLFITNSN